MSTLEEALLHLDAELTGLTAVALRLDESYSSLGEIVEEPLERLISAGETLLEKGEILEALHGDASEPVEFVLSSGAADALDELEEALENAEDHANEVEAAMANLASLADSSAEEQAERGEAVVTLIASSSSSFQASGEALVGRASTIHEAILEAANSRLEATIDAVAVILQEQFDELRTELVEATSEEIQNSLGELQQRLLGSLQTVSDETGNALAGLQQYAVDGIRRGVEEEADALLQSAIEALAREAIESVALTQVSAVATSALSPILPQLIVIRAVAEAIKRALDVMRMGF